MRRRPFPRFWMKPTKLPLPVSIIGFAWGVAELGGFDLRLNPARRKTLEMVVTDLFPGSSDVSKADFWTGLRPI